jgi:hypothetical protein
MDPSSGIGLGISGLLKRKIGMSSTLLNNQLLGRLLTSEEAVRDSTQIPGTQPLACSKSLDGDRWQLQLFGTPGTVILSGSARQHNASAYIWGTVAHPDIQTSQIPAWAAQIVAEQRYERLKELLGYFVIFVDEPQRRRLSVVSDILGVRPLFYRRDNKRLIFGSDAWLLQYVGLTASEIDWDAVSSWILQGCNYTDKALFADLERLDAGSVVIFEESRQQVVPYVRFSVSDRMLSPQEAAEGIHAIMKPVCKALYSQHRKLNIALSGGYDSRYCLAMALETNADIDRVTTVSFTKEEGQMAAEVASVLGVPLETLPVKGSTWDIYDSVYHFTPDGFPITKFVTHCLAQRYPGVTMVNGYLGGPLLRSYEYKGFNEPTGQSDWPSLLLERNFYVTEPIRLTRWFGEEFTQHVLRRARCAMTLAMDKGAYMNRLLSWADLYFAQPRYYANNFLQHLHLAEAILPLYSYSLIAFKLEHHPSVLSKETCVNIFRKHFPKLAPLPHATDLEASNAARRNSSFLSRLNHRPIVARCTAKWARRLLPTMIDPHSLPALRKKRTLLYTLASTSYLLQRLSYRLAESTESAIFNFERFSLLEKRCRDAGLKFDWRCI